MASMTREEILKRIEIEDARIANADRNIEGLILQKNKSLDEQARLFALLETLPPEEVVPEEETGV
jgi:DNA modification methylase